MARLRVPPVTGFGFSSWLTRVSSSLIRCSRIAIRLVLMSSIFCSLLLACVPVIGMYFILDEGFIQVD